MSETLRTAKVVGLAETPADTPVAVLLRHSVRGPLPPGDAGNAVPITPGGAARRPARTGLGNRVRIHRLHRSSWVIAGIGPSPVALCSFNAYYCLI